MATDRRADVNWQGSLMEGSGTIRSTTSGKLGEQKVSWANRSEDSPEATSPEELIAAAHATCFTMALALVLGEAGTPPERLTTSADCVLADVDGAPRITDITLRVRADVESLDEGAFNDAVAQAAALCPVSNALRDNVAISMDAALASHSIAE